MVAILNFGLDLSKYQNDARNGLSVPHLVGKVVLHGLLCQFVFKLHFHYGRRWPSWILMFRLAEIQKWCHKQASHATISRKSGIIRGFHVHLFLSFIFNMAAGGHFGFWLLQNSAAIFARVMGAHFFGHDGVSNHQPHNCLLNCLFRRRWKKTSKLRVIGHCAGNSPLTGEFPAQMASNAENLPIWWRHHKHHRSAILGYLGYKNMS